MKRWVSPLRSLLGRYSIATRSQSIGIPSRPVHHFPASVPHQPAGRQASGRDRIVLRRGDLVFGQIDGDVDDHVLLTSDVTGLAHPAKDLVGRDAVPFGGAL